jgi:DNA-binding PadR family transcriptional regulator
MNTSNLCLGALFMGDASGYEIKHRFETTFSHFQQASFGAIYPALDKLEREGLVSCRIEAQEKRPDKKVFSLTDTGRQHFIDALQTTEPKESCRSDFILLMFYAEFLQPDKLQEVLEKQEAKLQQTIETLTSIRSTRTQSPGALFTLDLGITVQTAALEFLQQRKSDFSDTDQ